MLMKNGMAKVAKRLGYRLKKMPVCAGTAILAGGMMFCGSAMADEVDFEDFEGLPLEPFVVAGGGDGTDWTTMIRNGTDRAWTVDNSGMAIGTIGDGTDWTNIIPGWEIDNTGNFDDKGGLAMSSELAFDGWAVLDVNSWIEQQGVQIGRTLFNIEDPNNSTLVCDGDAFDDFGNPSPADNGINSYICRTYDLTGFDSQNVTITFEYEFAAYASQTGVCEVSFDGGATYETLLELDSEVIGNSVVVVDFAQLSTGAVGADSMKLRFGYIEADNDWWFAIDNITVQTNDGFSDFEDFEGLDLLPFGDANAGGTTEPAYDGFTAMDVDSWSNEQGEQLGRTALGLGTNNTALVADPDAWDDFTQGATEFGYNSFISRSYDLSAFDEQTLTITFDYEFASYDAQLGTVEVSFDGGAIWQNLLTLDSLVLGNSVLVSSMDGPDPFGVRIVEPVSYSAADGDFEATSSEMLLRIGCTVADNDWWFAVDNILLEADGGDFLLGDVNCDGEVNLLDVTPFVNVITNGEFNAKADINQDGTVDLLDVTPFVNLLSGG